MRFVSVNVNGRDAYKLGALPITADAKLALRALTDAARAAGVTANDDWVAKAQRLAGDWETTKREHVYVDRPGEDMGYRPLISGGRCNAVALASELGSLEQGRRCATSLGSVAS